MKALSIKVPWSTAIMDLGKDFENRNWKTKFRGTVAIHSSNIKSNRDFEADCDHIRYITSGKILPEQYKDQAIKDAGYIIGTVEIVDCVEISNSPWFFGKYGFKLVNPKRLEIPIPIKGKLGFWELPEEVARTIQNHCSHSDHDQTDHKYKN